MASAASTTPPDLLALAASFLDYLNSLGLGPLPGVLAIGLGGIAVALGTVAYLWNGFAGLINPALDFLHIPKVPTIPVCFFGQNCGGAAAAQARPAAVAVAADSGDTAVEPAPPVWDEATATARPPPPQSTLFAPRRPRGRLHRPTTPPLETPRRRAARGPRRHRQAARASAAASGARRPPATELTCCAARTGRPPAAPSRGRAPGRPVTPAAHPVQRKHLAQVPGEVTFGVMLGMGEVLGLRRPRPQPLGKVAADRDVPHALTEQRLQPPAEPVAAQTAAPHREPQVGPAGHGERR